MKKLLIVIFAMLLLYNANSYAFSLDKVKKGKIALEISAVVAKDGQEEDFLSCVSTKDPSVYLIITDKEKMGSLKDLPLKDLENINELVQSCKIS